jgi:hypothetical protein
MKCSPHNENNEIICRGWTTAKNSTLSVDWPATMGQLLLGFGLGRDKSTGKEDDIQWMTI